MKHLLPAILALAALNAWGQSAVGLRQVPLSRWGIGSGQFSGITALGHGRYAVVSDKEPTDGFFTFRIDQSPTTGEVVAVSLEGFCGNPRPTVDASGMSIRDCEGVAFFPGAGTVFISGEGDQQILEYAADGRPTGRRLTVPQIFALGNIVPNYGFEALAYDTLHHRFWATTESTLPADGPAASARHPGVRNVLRLQSWDDALQSRAQYAYRMDVGRTDDFGKLYVFGVPEVTPLPDGRLIVLEREANVTNGYMGSSCRCKLFVVDPDHGHQIDSSTDLAELDPNLFLEKRLIADFETAMTPFRHTFANYEGMCLGQPLTDGRLTLLLMADSQGGFGRGPIHLKDFVKVFVIGN